jgi:hypothetical protein
VAGVPAATDATTLVKGVIQLAGDLSGTASAPTVPGLAAKADKALTISAGTGLSGGGDLSANRTLAVTNDSTTQKVELAKGGTLQATRKRINLIEGSNVTITTSDDSANNKVDVTIAASSSGSSSAPYIVAGNDAPSAIKSLANGTGDGTATGDTTALTAALAQAVNRPIEIYGSFIINTPLSITADYVSITGHNAVLYLPDSNTVGLNITGSRADLGITFTATLSQGTNVIPYSALTTVPSVGQWLGLVGTDNTTGEPWGSRPGENFYGEWLQVESVDTSGQTITVKFPFRETYHVTSFSYKLFGYTLVKRPHVQGLRFVGPGGANHPTGVGTTRNRPFAVTYSEDALIEDCHVEAPYGREGIAAYESLRPRMFRCTTKDVNDLNGTQSGGSYEAYGLRVMGCESATVENCSGSGSRHVVEVNGGQNGYGITGGLRPVSYNTHIRRVTVHKSWSAGVGDHPGSCSTVFQDITTIGCSGGIFTRGKRARVIGSLTVLGGHHLQGPYPSNQGNDHAITIGEQQRDTSSNNDNTTRGGWCGTGVVVDVAMNFDMTGNGATLASTAHAVHVVHPLDGATIKLKGTIKPTGNGVNLIGSYCRDTLIEISGIDMSSAFSTNGYFVNLALSATVPTTNTGQYVSTTRIDVIGVKPRTGAVYIAGNAANDANRSDGNEIRVRSRTLGTGLTPTSPLITLGASPNATTGYHGTLRLHDVRLPDVNKTTAVDISSAVAYPIIWTGMCKFLDGAVVPGADFLVTGDLRTPAHTGMTTFLPTSNTDKNIHHLWKVMGTGQTFSQALIGVSNVGSGGAGQLLTIEAYADDGTGKPALNKAPLLVATSIDPTVGTGEQATTISFTEPIGPYHLGYFWTWTTDPTTWPTLIAYTITSQGTAALSSGTNAVERRNWSQTASSAGANLTTLTADTSTRAAVALRV